MVARTFAFCNSFSLHFPDTREEGLDLRDVDLVMWSHTLFLTSKMTMHLRSSVKAFRISFSMQSGSKFSVFSVL